MTSRHLGKRLYLLADGRLERAESLEAMTHLEACETCAKAWHEVLEARFALQTSGSGIDMRFAQRLLDRERIAEIASAEPRRHAKAARGLRPHVFRLAIAAAAGLSAVFAVLYALGCPPSVGFDAFASAPEFGGRAMTVVSEPEVSAAGLAAWAQPAWGESALVLVSAVVLDDDGVRVLRATMRFGDEEMLVTERTGRLAVDGGASAVRAETGSREVYVLDGPPSSVLFQSTDHVVRIDCYCALEVTLKAVGEFPAGGGPGVLDRVGSGMEAVADAVTGR